MSWSLGNTGLGDLLGFNTDTEDDASDLSKDAGKKADQWWNQTAGLRNGLVDRLTQFMQGGFDPTASSQYAAGKQGVDNQYNIAKDEIFSTMAPGGGLQEMMANLSTSKSQNMVQLIAQIVQDEYNKAFQIGATSPSVTFQGLGTAGDILSPVIDADAQTQSAEYGMMGNILG